MINIHMKQHSIISSQNVATKFKLTRSLRPNKELQHTMIRTDNGHEFQTKFHWHVGELGMFHVYIKPATP